MKEFLWGINMYKVKIYSVEEPFSYQIYVDINNFQGGKILITINHPKLFVETCLWGRWSSGYDVALTRRRSQVRILPGPSLNFLAVFRVIFKVLYWRGENSSLEFKYGKCFKWFLKPLKNT